MATENTITDHAEEKHLGPHTSGSEVQNSAAAASATHQRHPNEHLPAGGHQHHGGAGHHFAGLPEGASLHPGLWKPQEHRKFANPAPLGLSAFALTTFVLSALNMGARGVTAPNIIISLAFGYGGLVQLLAGMWEMAVGNTFGATALSSYGGFWISFAIILIPDLQFLTGENQPYQGTELDSVLGFFLTGWFIFTFLLLLCTLRSTVAFFLLFFTLDLAFLFLSCHYYAAANGAKTASDGLRMAGGFFGFLAAFLAWYNALAGIMDSSNSFFTVPVFHFPWSDKGRELRKQKSERSMA